MIKTTLALAAAAAIGGFAGTASAMPISNLSGVTSDLVQDVRLVCDRRGNCWRTGRRARVYVAPQAYGYYGGYGPGFGYGYPYGYYGGGPSISFSLGGPRWGW